MDAIKLQSPVLTSRILNVNEKVELEAKANERCCFRCILQKICRSTSRVAHDRRITNPLIIPWDMIVDIKRGKHDFGRTAAV